jgi:hypothetical protein
LGYSRIRLKSRSDDVATLPYGATKIPYCTARPAPKSAQSFLVSGYRIGTMQNG